VPSPSDATVGKASGVLEQLPIRLDVGEKGTVLERDLAQVARFDLLTLHCFSEAAFLLFADEVGGIDASHNAAGLDFQTLAGGGDLGLEFGQRAMARHVFCREHIALGLEPGQVVLEAGHRLAGQHGGRGAGFPLAGRLDLGFEIDALHLGSRQTCVEICEPLDDQVRLVAQGDDVVSAPVVVERYLGLVEAQFQLSEGFLEPGLGVLGGLYAHRDPVLDVGPGMGVGHPSGALRIGTRELDPNQVGVPGGVDVQCVEIGRDPSGLDLRGARKIAGYESRNERHDQRPRSEGGVGLVFAEAFLLQHAFREAAALQDSVLCLVVGVRERREHGSDLRDLRGGGRSDQQQRPRRVRDWGQQEQPQPSGEDHHEHCEKYGAPLLQGPPVILEKGRRGVRQPDVGGLGLCPRHGETPLFLRFEGKMVGHSVSWRTTPPWVAATRGLRGACSADADASIPADPPTRPLRRPAGTEYPRPASGRSGARA